GGEVGKRVEIKKGERGAPAGREIRFRNLAQASRVIQVFIDTKILVQAEGLCQVSHVRTGFAGCTPQDTNLAAAFTEHAADDAECGRLAGSVGADQSEDFSFPYFETDLIDSLQSIVAFGKRVRFDHCLDGHHWLPI